MSLSVYVHIPYCIQRCRYCDFTTFEQSQIMPPEGYFKLLYSELKNRHHTLKQRHLKSVYFGGGTPSLVPAHHIVSFLEQLSSFGFQLDESTEITIEINPATLTKESFQVYNAAGVNRFSVGAQTFNDDLLKLCGREHSAQQTHETLEILDTHNSNYSFDLLFALPGQTIEGVVEDIRVLNRYNPSHLSAYCLTVPSGHPMSKGRPPEEQQIEMFNTIEEGLRDKGLLKYEISNFSLPGKESVHNSAYWNNSEYWGLGLSAHSYLRSGPFGTRFWNPKSFKDYEEQCGISMDDTPFECFPPDQVENLEGHESLTDICHMFLRTRKGLSLNSLPKTIETQALRVLIPRLQKLEKNHLLSNEGEIWRLTPQGEVLSNQVFSELTFLPEDLKFPIKNHDLVN